MIFNMRSKKGQSLIEAMAALSVLTVGFLGIISLLSKSFFYGRDVSDTMKATYLASEGIEIAKNLIDHDVTVASEGGGGGWGSCFGSNGTFELDYATLDCNELKRNIVGGDPLFFDPTNNLYGYVADGSVSSGATPTNFIRLIRVKGDENEITINSIVTWSTGPITNQSINAEDEFYNWKSQ